METPKKKPSAALVAVVLVALVALFYTLGNSIMTSTSVQTALTVQPTPAVETPAPPKEYLVMEVDPKIGRGEISGPAVVGAIRNTSDKPYTSVFVQFAILDGDGAQIGDAIATTNNLAAGMLWKFKASITSRGWKSFKLTSIKGYD